MRKGDREGKRKGEDREMREGHDHVERERGERDRETGEMREKGKRAGRGEKPPFIVGWVTWQQPGNQEAGKAWLWPGDCRGGVQPAH